MPYDLSDKLVVGISTRALFDLGAENEIFERDGVAAYRSYQREHEQDPLRPGTAFPLLRALLHINVLAGAKLVEVIVISRNDADTSLRFFNSLRAHNLAISRGVFRGGRDPWPYLEAFECSLFLSAEPTAVVEALAAHVPAALVLAPPDSVDDDQLTEVRIAFDGDAVLFGDESERIYQEQGIDAFQANETSRADEPLDPGPFASFLSSLTRLQNHFPEGAAPIRTALVTARNAPAHERVVKTLRAWNVRIDESFFLGGIDKTAVLRVFRPHIFFDDQMSHLASARAAVPSAHVIPAGTQMKIFDHVPEVNAPVAPIVVIPPMDLTKRELRAAAEALSRAPLTIAGGGEKPSEEDRPREGDRVGSTRGRGSLARRSD